MSKPQKAHVVVDRWRTGAFHVEYHRRCRCGAVFTHYNARAANEAFKAHQAEEEAKSR